MAGAQVLMGASAAGAICDRKAGGPSACDDSFAIGAATSVLLDVTANDGHHDGLAVFIEGLHSTGSCTGAGAVFEPYGTTELRDRYRRQGLLRIDLPAGFGGCSFRYQLSDGQRDDGKTRVVLSTIEPQGGLAPLAVDDEIVVLPGDVLGGAVRVPVAVLLANDLPAGEIGFSDIGPADRGTASWDESSGELVYALPGDGSFWTLGARVPYEIALLSDPDRTAVADVVFLPQDLDAEDDVLTIPLGTVDYEFPTSWLTDNDRPAGQVRLTAISDQQLPSHQFVSTALLASGQLTYRVTFPIGGLQGEVGASLGTFRYVIAPLGGGSTTAEGTVRVVIGEPFITTRIDTVIFDYDPAAPGCQRAAGFINLPVEDLLANDDPPGLLEVVELSQNCSHIGCNGFPAAVYFLDWLGEPTANLIANSCSVQGCQDFWRLGYGSAGYKVVRTDDPNVPPARVDGGIYAVVRALPRDDQRSTVQGVPLVISYLTGFPSPPPESILFNDCGTNGRRLTGIPVLPAHGSLQQLGFQTLLYTPDPGFVGIDSFRYETVAVNHPSAPPATATVSIDVTPIVARPDVVLATAEAFPLIPFSVAGLLSNDHPGGRVQSAGFGPPLAGTLEVVDPDPLTGSYRYWPGSGFGGGSANSFEGGGVDRFEQRIELIDGDGAESSAPVFLLAPPLPEQALLVSGFEGEGGLPFAISPPGSPRVVQRPQAAVGGALGLGIDFGPGKALVIDQSLESESGLSVRILFDASGLELPFGAVQALLQGLDGGAAAYRLLLVGDPSAPRVLLRVFGEKGSVIDVPPGGVAVAPGWHGLRVDWWASGDTDPADGGALLWLDGELVGNADPLGVGFDNRSFRVSEVRLGDLTDPGGASGGSLLMDEYASWRGSRVGTGPPAPDPRTTSARRTDRSAGRRDGAERRAESVATARREHALDGSGS